MTRARCTYVYDHQSVVSPSGTFVLECLRGPQPSVKLCEDGLQRWIREVEPPSPKQLFVADDGTSAVLDAADVVSFWASGGELIGRVSLLEEVCDGDPLYPAPGPPDSPVTESSAGPIWDDYLAGSFLDFGTSTYFVMSGRGSSPLVYDAAAVSRVEVDEDDIRAAQRTCAPRILAETLKALRARTSDDWRGREPWRMAAVGWSRVAGETTARDAIPSLQALATLPMAVDGMTYLPGYPQPRDPFRVNRYGLDPLRQATHAALLRLGQAAPAEAVLQLARRRSWFRNDWVAINRPTNWTRGLEEVAPGIMPSGLVDLLGAPNHIDEYKGRIVWSYDYLEADQAMTMDVRWGKPGAEDVARTLMPAASACGRVA